jgi:hypothetical protein
MVNSGLLAGVVALAACSTGSGPQLAALTGPNVPAVSLAHDSHVACSGGIQYERRFETGYQSQSY